jgi:hypothetical protein
MATGDDKDADRFWWRASTGMKVYQKTCHYQHYQFSFHRSDFLKKSIFLSNRLNLHAVGCCSKSRYGTIFTYNQEWILPTHPLTEILHQWLYNREGHKVIAKFAGRISVLIALYALSVFPLRPLRLMDFDFLNSILFCNILNLFIILSEFPFNPKVHTDLRTFFRQPWLAKPKGKTANEKFTNPKSTTSLRHLLHFISEVKEGFGWHSPQSPFRNPQSPFITP